MPGIQIPAYKFQEAITKEFDHEAKEILSFMAEGRSLSDAFADLHGLIADLVHNEAEEVSRTLIEGSEAGEYPVSVMQFAGIFFVSAPQFDTIGYFSSHEEAEKQISLNWM